MTMKEVFKKVAAFNEMAEILKTNKAQVYFWESEYGYGYSLRGEHFDNITDFRKYVRDEYQKEIADKILKADDWEFNVEHGIEWAAGHVAFTAELVTV